MPGAQRGRRETWKLRWISSRLHITAICNLGLDFGIREFHHCARNLFYMGASCLVEGRHGPCLYPCLGTIEDGDGLVNDGSAHTQDKSVSTSQMGSRVLATKFTGY